MLYGRLWQCLETRSIHTYTYAYNVQELLEKRSISVGGETTKIELNPQQVCYFVTQLTELTQQLSKLSK